MKTSHIGGLYALCILVIGTCWALNAQSSRIVTHAPTEFVAPVFITDNIARVANNEGWSFGRTNKNLCAATEKFCHLIDGTIAIEEPVLADVSNVPTMTASAFTTTTGTIDPGRQFDQTIGTSGVKDGVLSITDGGDWRGEYSPQSTS